jgi:hypothetical protein
MTFATFEWVGAGPHQGQDTETVSRALDSFSKDIIVHASKYHRRIPHLCPDPDSTSTTEDVYFSATRWLNTARLLVWNWWHDRTLTCYLCDDLVLHSFRRPHSALWEISSHTLFSLFPPHDRGCFEASTSQ